MNPACGQSGSTVLLGAIDAANVFDPTPEDLRIVTLRMDEAISLQSHIDAMRRALQAMVSAQHAGPITDEMYLAWSNAKALLN